MLIFKLLRSIIIIKLIASPQYISIVCILIAKVGLITDWNCDQGRSFYKPEKAPRFAGKCEL